MSDDDKKYIGDEFVEEDENVVSEKEQELEGLYDLVIPPGVPQKILMEVMEQFNVEVTTRKCAVKTIDVDSENLLVLRGELEDINNAHDYIFKKLSEKYKYQRK